MGVGAEALPEPATAKVAGTMPDLLEFEEPIGVLLKEIEALSLMPRTSEREKSIATLRSRAEQIRAEQIKDEYDFIVSRAVTRLKEFYGWVHRLAKKKSTHDLYNGILYLKGGDLDEELAELKKPYQLFALSDYFKEEFFETKKVVYVPLS